VDVIGWPAIEATTHFQFPPGNRLAGQVLVPEHHHALELWGMPDPESGLQRIGIVLAIPRGVVPSRLEVCQDRRLLPTAQLQGILKVFREVGEHERNGFPRVIGSQSEGRQLPALAAKGMPQIALAG
jgi:hypothetical protein